MSCGRKSHSVEVPEVLRQSSAVLHCIARYGLRRASDIITGFYA